MEIAKLQADVRSDIGKGPVNRLRRAGKIPAVAYGNGLASTSVAVSPRDLSAILKSDFGQNSVIELDIAGKDRITVMVREYAYHPVTRELVHADFYQVKMDQPVEVDIPCKTIGKSVGVAQGGRLQQIFRTIPVRALPDKIPSLVELDVTELDLHDTLKASDIKLPEGVTVRLPDNQTVAVVNAPEKVVEETPEEGAEVVPGAEAGAAAPAAGPEEAK